MEQEKVWDGIAEKWAEFRTVPTREVVDFLDAKKGRILDLGCGSGRHCSPVDGLEFYGIDFSERLLAIALEKGYIEVKKGYSYAIPYGDCFFDYVVFSRVLHCVEGVSDRKKSLEEIYRVLKKGGEALITSWGKKGCRRLGKGVKEGFVSWSVGDRKFERYTYVYDFEELRGLIEDVGFRVLKSWEDGCVGFVVCKD